MRHPLNWLARLRRSPAETQALLGDLEEEYRNRIRGRQSWIGAQAWYARELLTAGVIAMSDTETPAPPPAQPRRTFFRMRLLPDLRYALRRWRRRPAFAATAILTLALGIAAATAIFSIVDAVLLRPLPWKDPESLVVIHGVYPNRRANPATATTWNRGDVSYPVWDALRTTPLFESVGVWRSAGRGTTLGTDRTQLLEKLEISSNFLPMLGVPLSLGRYFTEREDNVPSDSILIAHETWQKHFAGRPGVIGERIGVGRASSGPGETETKTIVGVLSPGFIFQGLKPEVLEPVGISAAMNRKYFTGSLRILARLNNGTGIEAARSAAATLATVADSREPMSARLVPLIEEQLGGPAQSLWLLFGGAGLLLLVACTNVAGLLLGEARVRRHEIAVRAALGGTRARVMRQLLVEHTLMALTGAALGVLFARWMLRALVAIAPEGLPRLDTVAVDLRVVAFAFAAGLGTLLIFGIAPAFTLARTPVARVLAEGSRDGGVSKLLGQRFIVVAEIGLALVLLTGAHLFGETILRLTSQPIGFAPKGLLVVSTTFTGNRLDFAKFREAQQLLQAGRLPGGGASMRTLIDQSLKDTGRLRTDQVLERIAAVPGVQIAAGSNATPFVGNPFRVPVVLEGRPLEERHDALQYGVTDRYFETMQIPLLNGRAFGPGDTASSGTSEQPVIVSAEFERRFFPDGAVGRKFRYVYGGSYELAVHHRVIGVAGDVKRQEFADDDRPAYYISYRQSGGASHFLVRSAGDPAALVPAIRRAVADVTPELVVTASEPLMARVERSVVDERFRATLSSLFGGAALLLAAVGLYGLVTRRAADRRREFGVRVALGARPGDVRRLVIKDATYVIALGLIVGLPAAYAAAQVTNSLLFGVTPSSPHVFVATAATLAIVALIATLLPARRASKADPILALKE